MDGQQQQTAPSQQNIVGQAEDSKKIKLIQQQFDPQQFAKQFDKQFDPQQFAKQFDPQQFAQQFDQQFDPLLREHHWINCRTEDCNTNQGAGASIVGDKCQGINMANFHYCGQEVELNVEHEFELCLTLYCHLLCLLHNFI
jgi:hypothetical protein